MNQVEFAKLFAYLCKAYRVSVDDDTLNIYYAKLHTIDRGVLKTVVSNVVLTDKFFPSIARLVELCGLQLEPVLTLDAAEQWAHVLKLVRQYGSSRREKAYELLDPATVTVVRSIGWQDICQSDSYMLNGMERRFKAAFSAEQRAARRRVLGQNMMKRDLTLSKEQVQSILDKRATQVKEVR